MADDLSNLPPLSDTQMASARAHWVSQGLDPNVFDNAAVESPTPDAREAPQGDKETGATRSTSASKTPSLTAQEVAAMRAEWIAQGHDPIAFDAALDADGIEAPVEDTRTEEQVEYDLAFGPKPSPSDYKINYVGRLPADLDIGEVAEQNRQLTSWLSELELPPLIGTSIIETALDHAQTYAQSSDSQRELWKLEQVALFTRLAGSPEKAKERMDFAKIAIARGNPVTTAALYLTGALHSADTVTQLAVHGERLSQRKN